MMIALPQYYCSFLCSVQQAALSVLPNKQLSSRQNITQVLSLDPSCSWWSSQSSVLVWQRQQGLGWAGRRLRHSSIRYFVPVSIGAIGAGVSSETSVLRTWCPYYTHQVWAIFPALAQLCKLKAHLWLWHIHCTSESAPILQFFQGNPDPALKSAMCSLKCCAEGVSGLGYLLWHLPPGWTNAGAPCSAARALSSHSCCQQGEHLCWWRISQPSCNPPDPHYWPPGHGSRATSGL